MSVAGFPEAWYFPIDSPEPERNLSPQEVDELFDALYNAVALVFHNALHDLEFLRKFGRPYLGKFYDTMLMMHWLDEEYYDFSLNAVSIFWGGKPKNMPIYMKEFIEKNGWDEVPVDWMNEYSCNDGLITQDAFQKMLPLWQAEGFEEPWETEQIFIREVMGPMKTLGIMVDLEFCAQEYTRGNARMAQLVKELGFKPTSSKKLKELLIDELGLPVVKHTKSCERCKRRESVYTHEGPVSFDKDAMKEYEEMLAMQEDPRATKVLEYKGWQKTVSSNYLSYMKLSVDSVLHPGYKLHGTVTGRLSCADPNLQQIPKTSDKDWNGGLKKAFIARPGYGLWSLDYSQLQFRMTVAYAGEQKLIDIFNDRSRDIFSEMAADMGWLRDRVKTLVYLKLFGGGMYKAAQSFGISPQKAKVILDRFDRAYPGILKASNEASKTAKAIKYVKTWAGRRRHFKRNTPTYRAMNAAIQGGEADIMKRAMINVVRNVCDENCHLLLQIHDEIVLEIKEGMEDYYIPLAQAEMERAPEDFCKYIGVDLDFKTSAAPWGAK